MESCYHFDLLEMRPKKNLDLSPDYESKALTYFIWLIRN